MKILVVDDDADIRALLKDMFSRDGFDVSTALDGPGALASALDTVPDAVIIDQKLKSAYGLDVISDMRAAGYKGCAVLFSGMIDTVGDDLADALDVTTVSKAHVTELSSIVSDLLKTQR